jgi:hypothetical protein
MRRRPFLSPFPSRAALRRGARFASVLVILVAVPDLSRPVAYACTCLEKPPVCQAYWDASVVFTGQVVDIADAGEPASARGGDFVGTRSLARFRVDKAYRGLDAATVEVTVRTGRTPAECGFPFVRRERYLVYAYSSERTNSLYTSVCTRTRIIADAREDLGYVERAATRALAATLSGSLMRYVKDLDGHLVFVDQPPGVALVLSDPTHRFEAISDSEGRFVFSDVPPGRYRLRLGSSERLVNTSGIRIRLRSGGCADVDVHVTDR